MDNPVVWSRLHSIVEAIAASEDAWPFLKPVNWRALGLDDYRVIITEPMDVKTLTKKVKSRSYTSAEDFWRDVELMWSNCQTYNSEDAEVFAHSIKMADFTKKLKSEFMADFPNLLQSSDALPSDSGSLGGGGSSVVGINSNKSHRNKDAGGSITKQESDNVKLEGISESSGNMHIYKVVSRLRHLKSADLIKVLRYIYLEAPSAISTPFSSTKQLPTSTNMTPGLNDDELELDVGMLYASHQELFRKMAELVKILLINEKSA